jgi:hypothetical protein
MMSGYRGITIVSRRVALLVCALVLVGSARIAAAATVTLQWDANTEPDISGYLVLYGTRSGVYDTRIDVGKTTAATLTINAPATATYYFVVAAYSPGGTSDPSAEVLTTIYSSTSNVLITVDAPAPNATLTSAFEIGGWALDLGAQSSSGVDAVQFYVFPNDGAAPGVFVGQGSYGSARADVGAAYGSQFTNSGYHFTITGLGPGKFMLGVYARSTVTGGFSAVKTQRFTVSSTALMSIDSPGPETTITAQTFSVSGWAIDRSVEATAIAGTGVDFLHVYAYPNPGSGQAPIFLGTATPGIARSDVAGFYGSRYVNCGYTLNVNRSAAGLAPGVYSIVVHAHSTAAGAFNNSAVVRVTLQ